MWPSPEAAATVPSIATPPPAAPATPASEVAAAPPPAPNAPEPQPSPPAAAPAPEHDPRATLARYYSDLNHRSFEAARYFAPSIKRYITMKSPTPQAIDRYMQREFPKQFESYEFLLDEPTLREDGPNALVYSERCLYYLVKNHEFHNVVSEVRVEFDADGRIVDFHHQRVVARDVLPEKH